MSRKLVTVLLFVIHATIILSHGSHPLRRAVRMENVQIRMDPSIQLSASPSTLQESGQFVTVSWSNVSTPSADDWIAVYSQIPIRDGQAPASFQFCNASLTHMQHGYGSLKFYLINMRSSYMFALYRNGVSRPVQTAMSNAVTFANPNEVCSQPVCYYSNVVAILSLILARFTF